MDKLWFTLNDETTNTQGLNSKHILKDCIENLRTYFLHSLPILNVENLVKLYHLQSIIENKNA